MTEIVPRSGIGYDEWNAFAFQHGGWIWWTNDWLSYELAWGKSEDRSFGIYHGDRLAAIVPYLALDNQPSYNGEVPVMPLGVNWREAAKARGLVGTFRGHPVRAYDGGGWPTRVIDTQQTVAVLWHDLRHSNRQLIHRAQERYDVIDGPLAGQMLHDLYGQQAHALPIIPASAWQVLWRMVERGWLHFYAAVHRETGRCDGAIAVYAYGDWSYYGHGRSAVPNINHLLQWHVLTHPPARFYEIGWGVRPQDDAKAKAICFHKQGFGGLDWWVPTWQL